MNIDRMELADCGTPEALVAAILTQLPDLPIPVPIIKVAEAVGIVAVKEAALTGFEGGLIAFADKSEGTILVNSAGNPQRRRFTIGHELGHFLNPWHRPKTPEGFRCTSRDMRMSAASAGDRSAQMEVEANRFAAGLLFPQPWFSKDMAAFATVDLEQILALAKRYDMSKEATARRYVSTHREPCAVVVSQNGKVLRVYRHEAFPYVEVERDMPVPKLSASARASLKEGELTGWTEIDGGVWLSAKRGRRSPKVFEQVLGQRNGFRLTALTVEDDEDSDDDEDVERTWRAPRFRR
ncbi:MAG: ImmA/IrrE family metallo-endopeptidase [Ignavibacteriales bacterium]